MASRTFLSFLDRLVRQIPLIRNLEEENKELRRRLKTLDALEDGFDGMNTTHEALADRVKDLEEADEPDVTQQIEDWHQEHGPDIEEEVQKYLTNEWNPWEDPSFSESAKEWFADNLFRTKKI
jgi:uncharacterized protein YdcH (DUF465 family)